MNIGQLLGEIRELGIELVVEGERLRCLAPPGVLTAELASRIREAKPELLALLADAGRSHGAGSTIPHHAARGRFPLSFTQGRAVVSGRIAGALPTAFLLRGQLNLSALEETLRRIVARHMPLRTRFILDAEDQEQEVLAQVTVEVPLIDLSELESKVRAERLRTLLAELSRTQFDVAKGPLFRLTLMRLGPVEHVLHTAFNVLVFDGWSFDVFWQEMREGYAAICKSEPWPAEELPVTYDDFVAWQHQRVSNEIAHQADFWRQSLGDELPPLPLPTDRPRPRNASTRGKGMTFEIPVEMAAAVRRFAEQHAVTPQIVMLSAVYVWLARLGSTSDIVIASPVDARTQPSIEGLIGPFVNLLLLRNRVGLEKTFATYVFEVRDMCLVAYENQEFPLEQLEVRSPRSATGSFSPAFQVEFSYQQVSQRGSHMGNLSLSQLELESGASTNDITLWVKDWGERIAGAVEFKLDLFDQPTIEHWVACYKHLLRELIRNAQQPMQSVDLLGAEREAILGHFARISADPPTWLRSKLGVAGASAAHPLRVVDERDQLRPMGVPGALVIDEAGVLRRIGVRARLQHDGSLAEETEAKVAPKLDEVSASEPQTELEMRLCLLFQELLGRANVAGNHDYFELGGNSLIAVRLFGAIQEQFGVRLPMTTILDASTPRKLANAIKGNVDKESCIVRLKDGGSDATLFLVHDGDGETLLYRNLAMRLPKHVSVYGVEPLGSGRLTMTHTSIEELAAHYISEIRKRQPNGPYFLGGLCAGGLIAFEMARQLEQAGQDVGQLALIEASPPQAQKRASISVERWSRFSQILSDSSLSNLGETATNAIGKVKSYLTYEVEARLARARARSLCLLLRHVYRLGAGWPTKLPVPTVRDVFAFAEMQYVPARLARTPVVIFRATSGEAGDLPLLDILSDPMFGWGDLVAVPPRAVDVPGGHGTLLREPHVGEIAAVLCQSFERQA